MELQAHYDLTMSTAQTEKHKMTQGSHETELVYYVMPVTYVCKILSGLGK